MYNFTFDDINVIPTNTCCI